MNIKLLAVLTIVYIVVIFPITAIWHVGLFQELYLGYGYFNKEETLLAGIAGLLNIFVQGFILAILFLKTQFSGSPITQGLKIAAIVFVFYFSIQVVNFVVRKEINDIPFFILMEVIYMLIQFAIYGILIGFIRSKFEAKIQTT